MNNNNNKKTTLQCKSIPHIETKRNRQSKPTHIQVPIITRIGYPTCTNYKVSIAYFTFCNSFECVRAVFMFVYVQYRTMISRKRIAII